MDERMRKRIVMFYLAGVINAVLGFYVLLKGGEFLMPDKVTLLSFFFFAFAAVDFYFPQAMKKKWRQDQQKAAQARAAQPPEKS
jgi:uncharacterized membrane protein